jgi:hypothetical protein
LPSDTTEYKVNVISTAQQVNTENQSQVVLFEVMNANGRFKIGENLNVRIYSSDYTKQIIIPDAAIADVNGKPAVFIKDKAEQYSISYVNKGTSSGKLVNIVKGVEDGERVVTNGVYQMKTIFLNQSRSIESSIWQAEFFLFAMLFGRHTHPESASVAECRLIILRKEIVQIPLQDYLMFPLFLAIVVAVATQV